MKILGITDETNTCECCGKTNLKRVVVIEKDNGDIVRYGTDCASMAYRKRKSDISSLLDVCKYVQKWIKKYTPDIVAKGIINKRGFNAKVENGIIKVWLGEWVDVS